MPTSTTITVGRKRSFTISADKTVVVARTLGACAVFFLVIATTTWLPWASFGATLGQVGQRSKAIQAIFLYLLERLSFDSRKGDFRFFDPLPGTPKKLAVNRELFANSCKFLCKSMA